MVFIILLSEYESQVLCSFLILHCLSSTIGSLNVGFFDQPNLESYWTPCADFDENGKCPLNKDNNYRSAKILNGSCVEIVDDQGKSVWIKDDNVDLGQSFKGGYALKCKTNNVPLICPNGTFAKEIEWDSSSEITKGIKLSCYSPEFYKTNATILESHPGTQLNKSSIRKCAAIYGITFKLDDVKEVIVALDLKENCTEGYAQGIRSFCVPEAVISGIDVEIEEKTNYIKNVSVTCTEIPDIATLCKAEDEKRVLLSYDGTISTTFTIKKKFGVGQAAVMSDLIRNEFNFYIPSGFDIGKSIFTLSDNFKENLGLSNETDFDWSNTTEKMWQKEQSSSIKIITKSGCTTEVFEIVGRCSFLDVRPATCVQVDFCAGMSNETVIAVPDEIVSLTYTEKSYTYVSSDLNVNNHNQAAGVVINNAVRVVAKPLPLLIKNFYKVFDWINKLKLI